MYSTNPSLILLTAAAANGEPGASFLDQIKSGNLSYPTMLLLVVAGIFVLYAAYRIGRFILKIICILLGLAAIVAAISWFLLQH